MQTPNKIFFAWFMKTVRTLKLNWNKVVSNSFKTVSKQFWNCFQNCFVSVSFPSADSLTCSLVKSEVLQVAWSAHSAKWRSHSEGLGGTMLQNFLTFASETRHFEKRKTHSFIHFRLLNGLTERKPTHGGKIKITIKCSFRHVKKNVKYVVLNTRLELSASAILWLYVSIRVPTKFQLLWLIYS